MKNSISFLFPVTAAVAVLSCIASCSPIAYTMRLDLKTPSKSGIELGGKSVAVVYNDNGNSFDSLFIASVSEGFAEQLEKEYFSDRRAIGIFKTDGEADYVSKDSLVNILVDTGSDVVFYYDSPVFDEMTLTSPSKLANPSSSDSSYVSALTIPFSVKLYVYDSMDKTDEVREFSGSSTCISYAYSDGEEPESVLKDRAKISVFEPGKAVGKKSAYQFLPVWKDSSITIIYYDGMDANPWINALLAATDYRWKDALDIWMELAGTKNLQKRSCAQYNIAVACYMLGQKELASEWLDRSDADFPLSVSSNLRKLL